MLASLTVSQRVPHKSRLIVICQILSHLDHSTIVLSRFTHQKYNAESKPTSGIQFATGLVDVGGRTIKLQIWDASTSIRALKC